MNDIEQRRRDLKQSQPDLYSYIRLFESARAYDSAGDLASGAATGHDAANRIWAAAAATVMRMGGAA